jgi:hypothetical protein
MAMSASSRGVRESESMLVAPPKMKRVIPSTLRPKRRATIACDSSWARTDPKKRAAVAAATIQYTASGSSPGTRTGSGRRRAST